MDPAIVKSNRRATEVEPEGCLSFPEDLRDCRGGLCSFSAVLKSTERSILGRPPYCLEFVALTGRQGLG